ncbi:Hypothetical predicted protein [Pelobates cultripes]|uniref:Uncharacterized protein n=1 Tax=Pelobates cultripes TaxID=61616 RepID=A0AAD1R1F0_PELCU|nr:Hypothetical predicted protein [Pelobates cultripes]
MLTGRGWKRLLHNLFSKGKIPKSPTYIGAQEIPHVSRKLPVALRSPRSGVSEPMGVIRGFGACGL